MDFRKLFISKGLKATPQRLGIAEKIYENEHISIENLFSCLRGIFPTISLATIYKNINKLIERSIIEELKLPNRKVMFEFKKQPHSHTVCKQCNRICDIFVPIDTLQKQIDTLNNFSVQETSILFLGICNQCQTTLVK